MCYDSRKKKILSLYFFHDLAIGSFFTSNSFVQGEMVKGDFTHLFNVSLNHIGYELCLYSMIWPWYELPRYQFSLNSHRIWYLHMVTSHTSRSYVCEVEIVSNWRNWKKARLEKANREKGEMGKWRNEKRREWKRQIRKKAKWENGEMRKGEMWKGRSGKRRNGKMAKWEKAKCEKADWEKGEMGKWRNEKRQEWKRQAWKKAKWENGELRKGENRKGKVGEGE